MKHIDQIRDTLAPILCHFNLHVSIVVSHIQQGSRNCIASHLVKNLEFLVCGWASWVLSEKIFMFVYANLLCPTRL